MISESNRSLLKAAKHLFMLHLIAGVCYRIMQSLLCHAIDTEQGQVMLPGMAQAKLLA